MLVDENDSQKIYGKTGSGNGEAWFVGFSESDGERKYIAIYLMIVNIEIRFLEIKLKKWLWRF